MSEGRKMARKFEYSDEILPTNGLLAGSGGGFMQSYVDVHAGQGGDLALLQYSLTGMDRGRPTASTR